MIESVSSLTNLSGSKPNLVIAKSTTASSVSAPGVSGSPLRFSTQAFSRLWQPSSGGMPARPASSSFITRFDSVSANWPSRKNASRARVAIQFGLPRPALR